MFKEQKGPWIPNRTRERGAILFGLAHKNSCLCLWKLNIQNSVAVTLNRAEYVCFAPFDRFQFPHASLPHPSFCPFLLSSSPFLLTVSSSFSAVSPGRWGPWSSGGIFVSVILWSWCGIKLHREIKSLQTPWMSEASLKSFVFKSRSGKYNENNSEASAQYPLYVGY